MILIDNVYCRNNPMMYTDPSGMSFSSWWKKYIGSPFMQEWHHVFGNGITISMGTDTQFSSMNALIAPNPLSSKYVEEMQSVDSAGLSEAVTCAGNQFSL